MNISKYLKSGDSARLFPVLSTTSKEGRTTSIFLSCLSCVDELAANLLRKIGQRVGVRTELMCFTEVVLKNEHSKTNDRPDGLIVLRTGNREWKALVEAKIGSQLLNEEQIERYRQIAKENSVDCVITISNEFANTPGIHPNEAVRKSRSKVPVYHLSWMSILTEADLLATNNAVKDRNQQIILRELIRFLAHESAGVSGFHRMPPEWTLLNKTVSSGGNVPSKLSDILPVLSAWHQESKDLSLILSRQIEMLVSVKLSRKHNANPNERIKDDHALLREKCQLKTIFDIPDAAAPMEVIADLQRRTIEVGMYVRAPEDRKSSKARLNWLLRQFKNDPTNDLQIRCFWPGRSESTQFEYSQISVSPEIVSEGKDGLQVIGFEVFISRRLGGRFTQQSNFISDLESIVPEFYRKFGQNITAWQRTPPKIKEDRETPEEVSVAAIGGEVSEVS